MFITLGFLRRVFGLSSVVPHLPTSTLVTRLGVQQTTVGALMESADACAGSDLPHAQELRRAAIVLLGVSR